MAVSDRRESNDAPRETLPTVNPAAVAPSKPALHPAFYVILWISLSSSVILFNKWLLDTAKFGFPIFLTTWHMLFSTVATQILARFTTLLDGRKTVKMTGRVYMRAILPIGIFFSASLICGNQAYLYLTVSFIQMLKACTPVAVLLATWSMGLEPPNMRVFLNVSTIVVGVIIASYGEIAFNLTGVIFQVFGLTFEATRIVLVQRLLSSAEFKMDPLVSLYYFAPVCTALNFVAFLVFEGGKLGMQDILNVGLFLLLANAMVAFALNVSVVFLIGKTSGLVLTLCGVLKDILLVAASMIIWGNLVTFTQMFGYSIALSGLVYYKLGAAVIVENLSNMRKSSAMVWSEYGQRHPALRKAIVAGGAVLIVFLTFGMYNHNQFTTGVSAPSSGASPAKPAKAVNMGLMEVPIATLDTDYKPTRSMDIVVSMYKEDPAAVNEKLQKLIDSKALKSRNPHVVIYVKDDQADTAAIKAATGAYSVEKIPNRGRESGTYMHHMIDQWDNLAEHTLFLQGDFHDFNNVFNRLEDYFVPETGMLSLGFGHAACSCENCKDPWTSDDVWTRVPEIYSAVYEELCPPTKILLSYSGQFVVSARRIRGTEKRVYQHLKSVLESDKDHWIHSDSRSSKFHDRPDDPMFGHTLERSWMITFKCANPVLAKTCPKIDQRRKSGDADDQCQCLDSASSA